MLQPLVQTGLDLLVREEFAPLRGLRVGLVANPATVDVRLRHAADLLSAAPHVRLAALFGPKFGYEGDAPESIGANDSVHARHCCPVHSLYGDAVDTLRPRPETLRGLDALLVDLPDIGSRHCTFQATMLGCLEAAAASDLPVVILDRPNPLNGLTVEGPSIQPGFESFIGPHPIPIRHGMTLGELARFLAKEREIVVTLYVVECEGWNRSRCHDETFLPWVMPAPNLPTLDSALVYAGQCFLEGTNVSEGRGTTRPFEICGAPWVAPNRLAERLESLALPGVIFRPTMFLPTSHKHAGRSCGGVQLHIVDRNTYRPIRTGLAILAAMRELDPEHFRWRTEPYEFVDDVLAIDLLFGSSRERMAIQAGLSAEDIARPWAEEEAAFRARRAPFLLYGRT